MRKTLFTLICLFTLIGTSQAQDYIYNDPDEAYQAALEAIEEARVAGATQLDFVNFGLEELPPEIGQLTSLQTLSLYGNQLTTLPPEIGNLIDLTHFAIMYNPLKTLPEEIGLLTSLTDIYIFDTQLRELPPEIGKLSSLHSLGLKNNQLTVLPSEIGNLKVLLALDLRGNQLLTLPPEIGNIHSLQRLWLEDNPLKSPPPEVIAQGVPAIKDYLRNQAAWHIRQMTIGAAGGVGVLAMVGLFMRWRLRSRRKDKIKRKEGSGFSV